MSRVQIQLTTEATHPLKPRTGIISRVQIQLTTEVTHFLESQGQVLSAGLKSSSPRKPLTPWRAKDRRHQQGTNPAHHGSHSLPGEPKTGIISRFKIQLITEPLTFWRGKDRHHQQGRNPAHQRPLTNWTAKDRHHQQGPNPAHHESHSHTGEPRTGIVSR